jgi:non-specific serine/threonine protein kinase
MAVSEALRDRWIAGLPASLKILGIELELIGLPKNRLTPMAGVGSLKFIQSDNDWLDIKADLRFGDQVASIKQIRKAIMEGKDYIELADGALGQIPEYWMNHLSPLFRLGSSLDSALRLSKWHRHLAVNLAEEAGEDELAQTLHQEYEKLTLPRYLPEVSLPEGLQAEFRPYQLTGYRWLQMHAQAGYGALLADDMGLGKTVQMLACLLAAKQENPEDKHLVVMPNSLLFNWLAEAGKFTPELKLVRYHGSERNALLENQAWDVLLTTYSTMRMDVDVLEKQSFNYLILDESQAIKNPNSETYRAAMRLKAQRKVAMSGTPVENRTSDLFAQLNFLNPGLLGSFNHFQSTYARPIELLKDEARASELRKIITPFVLKRTKKEVVTELPEKSEIMQWVELSPLQKSLYEEEKERIKQEYASLSIEQNQFQRMATIIKGLGRLRQICSSVALLQPDFKASPLHSAKMKWLEEELLQVLTHQKALVFSSFLGSLDLVKQLAIQHAWGYAEITGKTKHREEEVRRFQEDDNCRLFLISLKAGGTGLNLTAAEYVFILDPWWNPAVENQAIDRTYRIGQNKPVFAYKLLAKDTIEEKILKLQQKKQYTADQLAVSEESLMQALSDQEIEELLS